MRVVLAVALAGFASTLHAQNLEPIFDLPLGAALDRKLNACDDRNRDGNDWCDRFPSRTERLPREVSLMRPYMETPRKIPTWITSGTATMKLDPEGKVVGISVTTVGPGRQATVLDSVSSRFGPPTLKEDREAKNAYGAAWKVTKAEWSLPNVYIYHNCFRNNECVLNFETPEEHARAKEEFERRREKDRM